jgi:hypothetical protein
MLGMPEFHRKITSDLIYCLSSVVLVGITIISCGNSFVETFAHQEYKFGNITITAGWEVEPPLVNQFNSVEVEISKNEAGGTTIPVRNAFSELDASIKSGGLTKSLDFQPQEESAGLYRAQILPTQIGSFSLLLTGNINNQSIDSELQIEDVEDTAKYAFPSGQVQEDSIVTTNASSVMGQQGQGTSVQGVASQLQLEQPSPLISEITKQINLTDTKATRAEMASRDTTEALQELTNTVDRAFVFVMISVGIGVGGIIIGAYALSRKGEGPADFGGK